MKSKAMEVADAIIDPLANFEMHGYRVTEAISTTPRDKATERDIRIELVLRRDVDVKREEAAEKRAAGKSRRRK